MYWHLIPRIIDGAGPRIVKIPGCFFIRCWWFADVISTGGDQDDVRHEERKFELVHIGFLKDRQYKQLKGGGLFYTENYFTPTSTGTS